LSAVAYQSNAKAGIGLDGLKGTVHDRSRRMIAAHRVERDTHGLLLLLFHVHDFPALVEAAVRADAMRQDRFVTVWAVLNLNRFDMEVAPPFALSGMGCSSLRDCHGVRPCQIRLWNLKDVILGGRKMSVKVRAGDRR
jgi:hypothetical protein